MDYVTRDGVPFTGDTPSAAVEALRATSRDPRDSLYDWIEATTAAVELQTGLRPRNGFSDFLADLERAGLVHPLEVEEVPFATVAPLKGKAARDRVSISQTNGTRWFAVLVEGKPVACAAVLQGRAGWRLKAAWTEPAWRGRGLGDRLTRHRIALAEHECAPSLEVFSLHPEHYERQGFARAGTLPNGAVKLRKRL